MSTRALLASRRRRALAVLLPAVLVVGACGGASDEPGRGSAARSTSSSAASGDPLDALPVDDTFPRVGSSVIDVTGYQLDLSWDPGTGVLEGTATLDLVTTRGTSAVPLDFGPLEVVTTAVAVAPVGGPPGELTDAGAVHRDGDLTISLPREVAGGTPVRVVIEYRGTPAPVTSVAPIPVGWTTLDGGGVATPSSPDAAHTWFPCNDVLTDKATFRTTISLPEGSSLTAVANGVPDPPATSGGRTERTWVMDAPMAPAFALVAIAEFEEQGGGQAAGVPIRNHVPARSGGEFAGGLGQQPSMLSFFADRLGPYPFREYGAVVVPGPNVALETQGRSLFFGPSARDRGTVAHELAHQWIGDSVSATSWRRDVWWVEGFARFAEWLWSEHSEGAATARSLAELAHEGLRFGDRLAIGELAPEDLFDRQVYDGGALVFAALRAELGEEAFFAAMRTFADRYRHSNATTEDLFSVFAEVAGRDVRPVAEPYLRGGPLPPFAF